MLLRLPDAVLTSICAKLPDECILAAALSCRRLNEFALRVFLARNDIPDPARECEVYLEGEGVERIALGLLRALHLATMSFLNSAGHISLIFLNADLSLGLGDLSRAAALIDRLAHIDTVSLEFRGTICEDGMQTPKRIQRQWNARFSQLWLSILRNRTVSSLSIRTKWDFFQSYMLYHERTTLANSRAKAPLTRFQASVKSLATAAWRRLRSTQKQVDLALSVRRALAQLPSNRPKLAVFHIDSPLILLPALYHLTLVTLQYCPITSLELHSVSVTNSNIADDIAAAVPSLSKLTIANIEMQAISLCRFLAKFPQLANLTIEPPRQYWQTAGGFVPPLPRDIPRLKALTELSLGSSYLSAFLKRPNFLAGVEHLNITIPMGDLLLPSLLNDLAPIAQYPPDHMHLRLDKYNLLASAIWAMENCIDVFLGMDKKWSNIFGHVEELTLVRTHYPALHESPVFRRWLALFPGVVKATWDEYSSDEFPGVFGQAEIYQRFIEDAKELESEPIRFTDLPDDILISIFELLSEELFDVALVCRRLNYLAIPIFLVSQNIWDRSTGCCTIKLNPYPAARDPLAALTIALVFPDIKEVRVNIPRSGYIYPSINHVRRLIPILQRLDMVETVSLRFGVATKMHLEEHHVYLQYRWCFMFQELLNIVVSKQSCTALHVQGSPYLFPDEVRWNQRHRLELRKRVSLSLPLQTNLTTLSFEPSALLSPIFEPWTVSVLHHSKISAIRLDVTLEDYRFVEIVSKALPRLRELEIRWLISPEKNLRIATFLSRLSQLETLRMSSVFADVSTQTLPLSMPIPHLPHLTTLAASIPYINHLLSGPNALPALQSLEISTLLSSSSTPPSTPIASLAILFQGLGRHELAPSITLAVIFRTTWERDPDWPRNAFDAVLGADWLRWCSTIMALKVSVTSPYSRLAHWDTNAAYVSFLRDRLRLFPALKEVWFTDGIEYKTEGEMMGMASAVVQTVKAAHPEMVGLIWVNGKKLQ